MEQIISGRIEFEGIRRSRSVVRFVEKRIFRWVAEEHSMGAAVMAMACPASYQVFFARQGEGHAVHCSVRIRLGDREWSGSCHAEGLHRALDSCLSGLDARAARSARVAAAAIEAATRDGAAHAASLLLLPFILPGAMQVSGGGRFRFRPS